MQETIYRMVVPALICLGAAAATQALGLNNGFLVGAFVSAALLSRTRLEMEEIPGSVTFLQIAIGLSAGIGIATSQHGVSLDLTETAYLVAIVSLALAVQWLLAVWVLRVSGWSWVDSMLAAYPGAMAAVLELTTRSKASDRVLFVHVLRLLLIALAAVAFPSLNAGEVSNRAQDLSSIGVLLAALGASLLLGRMLRLLHVPAPYMLAATGVGIAAIGTIGPDGLGVPQWFLRASEVFLAIAVMCRLGQISLSEIRCSLTGIILLFTTMIASVVCLAIFASYVIGMDVLSTILGLQPGGIETVAVVALGAGLNVGLIMKMHLVRLVLVHTVPGIVHFIRNARHQRTPLRPGR